MSISVDMCLGGRDLTEPKLSPDGATVAFVSRWGGECAILVVPVDGGPERILTAGPAPAPGRGLGGGCFAWLNDGSAIVYAARDGALWLQPLPGGPARRIADVGEGRRCEAPVVTPDDDTVLAVVDRAELWSWPLREPGAGERLDDGSADFVFDPFVTSCGSMVLWTAWNVPDMPWDGARVGVLRLDQRSHDSVVGSASVHQPRTLPDGRDPTRVERRSATYRAAGHEQHEAEGSDLSARILSVRDDSGWLNLWLGDEPLVDEPYEHAGPSWGMGQRSYAASPEGGRVAFTRNERGFGRLCVVDTVTRDVTEVARGVHGQLSWSADRLVALRTGARTPTQVVTYDTATWDRRVLAVGPVAGWEAADLPEPEAIVVAHDGAVLHGRRYRAGQGRTLCWVHGGPTDQWQVEFMPRIAYWWARGWDVLVPDPRGSTGHGREYQQALRGEWGRLDVDDTAAILAASHAAGTSDAARTVLIGSSSGGLTVLGLLGRHGRLAAAGVALYPVADLAVLADAGHRFEAHYPLTLVGPADDVDRYVDRSPVSYAHAIDAPLLVLHGDSDPVVPLSSSLALVDRIRAAGGDAELVVYEGEGHGFRDDANKRDEYRRTEEFLARVLDGR